MRITKEIATSVAKALLTNKANEITALKEEQKRAATALYIASIPGCVMEVFQTHKAYLKLQSQIQFVSNGLNYEYFSLDGYYPKNNDAIPKISANEAKKLLQYNNQISDLLKEYDALLKDIEVSLFALHTYNNVEKEFPEAFKLLPPSKVNTGLMINIKDIRCKLDKVNC